MKGLKTMAEDIKIVEGKHLTYLGKPLVREGDTICYGSKNDRCLLVLEIMTYKKIGNNEVPDGILVQIVSSKDPTKIIRQSQKQGLSAALNLGVVWLDTENRQS